MKKLLLLTVIAILFLSHTDKRLDVISKNNDTPTQEIIKSTAKLDTNNKKIPDSSRWTSSSDESSNGIDITFHDEYLIYWYHGQCAFYYFSYAYKDKVEMLWSYKKDCLLNMDLLENSYGLKNYPKSGEKFSSYKLLNDSTIKVTYYYPEWTKKVNEAAKDSIFPAYFRTYK